MIDWDKIEAWPAAEVLPRGPLSRVDDLAASIQSVGQLQPVVIYKGKVLDGLRRIAACKKIGVTPLYKELPGDIDVISYVEAACEHRDLTEGQRATLKLEFAKMRGNPDVKKVAEEAKVSTRTVMRSSAVLRGGVKELVEAVTNGDISLPAGEAVAKLPPVEQRKLLAGGPGEIAKWVRSQKLAKLEEKEKKSEPKSAPTPKSATVAQKSKPGKKDQPLQGRAVHGLEILAELNKLVAAVKSKISEVDYKSARAHLTGLSKLLEGWRDA